MVTARLCVAFLTLAITAFITSVMLVVTTVGWIGLGLLVLSLPVGPALGVLVTRRLLTSGRLLGVVPCVVSTWAAVLVALTLQVFVLRVAGGVSYYALLLGGAAFLGALVAPTRAHLTA